jgi:DNA processing protein
MIASDRVAWVALSLIPRMGSRTLAHLLDRFETLDAILGASEQELRTVRGVGPQTAAAIRAVDRDHTLAQMIAWEASGIAILIHGQDGYPAALDPLADAPPVLFQRGTLQPADCRAVALVGTRSPTEPARQIARSLAQVLGEHGWTVVSGLAAGVDTAAHQGALAAPGRTLAVLGCGVQVIYPPENGALADRIVAQGALFSEVQPDAPPNSPALVARNRLISGLSQAVIVIETGENGGTMHAVRFAREQGRPLYALDHEAAGNRRLIADGARALPPDPESWDSLLRDLT